MLTVDMAYGNGGRKPATMLAGAMIHNKCKAHVLDINRVIARSTATVPCANG